MASRVEQLFRAVEDARQARRERCRSLVHHVAQRLEEISANERRRNRQRAPRFNVFKYLRQDELGLSRVIADLLNPAAEHGQGTVFLELMLETLPETKERFGELQPTPDSPIKVQIERQITSERRMDITVDIPLGDQWFCLAFENKPYANDQSGQLIAYLEYLGEKYGRHFLLVYLPPDDREPDKASLSQPDRERWKGHFRVMPYMPDLRRANSLRSWFAACRNRCEADGVRWFLRSAESFCKDRLENPPWPQTPKRNSYSTIFPRIRTT